MHACSFHFGKILRTGSMLGCSCLANGLVVNSYISSASLTLQFQVLNTCDVSLSSHFSSYALVPYLLTSVQLHDPYSSNF
jgi:hypothetical protein